MIVLFSNFYLHAYILHRNKYDPNNYSHSKRASLNGKLTNGSLSGAGDASQSGFNTDVDDLMRPSLHAGGLRNGAQMLNGHADKKRK